MEPGIDSEESMPLAYVALRASTTYKIVVPVRQAGNRFLGFLKGLQIRARGLNKDGWGWDGGAGGREFNWSYDWSCTDKKEKKILLIYKEIQRVPVAGNGKEMEMRKYLVIYEEAVSHIWLCNRSLLDFLIYEENFVFFFPVWVTHCYKRMGNL